MRESLLIVEQLGCRYGGVPALEDLSFRLDAGEILGLLGPNGAGKTTCLRMLSGTLLPTEGRIQVRGRDLLKAPRRAKAAIGFLPERPPLYPEMRVGEYLAYCARLHRIPRKERREALERTLARCQLTEVRRRLIGTLSKGYRQRVGIAQAILHEPAVLILDEPTEGLDPLQVRDLRDLIRSLARECAVIFSSHILSEVQALCHRVLILQRGRVLWAGRLDPASEEGARYYRLGLDHPPAPAVLARMPGIRRVLPRSDAPGFRIALDPTARPSQIAAQVVQAGWGLRELCTEPSDLERRFFQVLTGEVEA